MASSSFIIAFLVFAFCFLVCVCIYLKDRCCGGEDDDDQDIEAAAEQSAKNSRMLYDFRDASSSSPRSASCSSSSQDGELLSAAAAPAAPTPGVNCASANSTNNATNNNGAGRQPANGAKRDRVDAVARNGKRSLDSLSEDVGGMRKSNGFTSADDDVGKAKFLVSVFQNGASASNGDDSSKTREAVSNGTAGFPPSANVRFQGRFVIVQAAEESLVGHGDKKQKEEDTDDDAKTTPNNVFPGADGSQTE